MSGAVDGTRGRVDEAVVRQAIHWLVRLRSQPADDRLQRACAAWRAEHGEHERAWQQVSALNEELQGRFKALPGGSPTAPWTVARSAAAAPGAETAVAAGGRRRRGLGRSR